MVLDDNPDLSPREVLAFEHNCRYLLDVEACLVYRDWLTENGCKRRVALMNNRLSAELEMLRRLAAVIEKKDRIEDDAAAKAWLDGRILMLQQAIGGQEDFSDNGIDGIAVLYFPNEQHALDKAREMADVIREGAFLALPSERYHNGQLKWDFKIEGGHPGHVKLERSGVPTVSREADVE